MTRSYEALHPGARSELPAVQFDADLTNSNDSKISRDAKNDKKPNEATDSLPKLSVGGGHHDDWIKGVATSPDGHSKRVTFSDGTVSTYTDGVLTSRTHPGGGTDTYIWKNGVMVEMDRADGKTLKLEGQSYVLYDSNKRKLGPSPFVVTTGESAGYQVKNRPVTASELSDPSGAFKNTEEEETISVDTKEPGKVKTLALLEALLSHDEKTAKGLLNEFESQGMRQEDVATAYRSYTGRSLKNDMQAGINGTYSEANEEAVDATKNRMERVFDKVDRDADGILSDDELSKAMNDKSFTGDDARLVAGLRRTSQDGLIVRSALQRDDVKAYEYGQSAAEVMKNFDVIDSNHDGLIDKNELVVFAGVKDNTRDQLSLLDTFKQGKDGLSKNDLEVLIANGQNPIATSAGFRSDSSGAETSLYGDGGDANKAIRPENFGQGSVGDCHLMSTLSSMAASEKGREQIKNMIKDNGDGTYTVTFPGAPDEPITVDAPTEAQQTLYARTKVQGTGYWSEVIEKAYGEYVGRSVFRRSVVSLGSSDVQQENAGTGAASIISGDARTLTFLTGSSAVSKTLSKLDDDQLEAMIKKSSESGTPMILSRGANATEIISGPDAEKAPPGRHFYAIVGYNPQTHTVTVMNPWNSSSKYGGKFEMSMSELKREFGYMAYNDQ